MLPFLGPLLGGVVDIGKQYFTNKAEKSKAKHDQQIAVIRGDQKWEEIQAQNSNESWKDEYLTIIITAPFVAMFLAAVFDKPQMVSRIGEAFIILQSEVPEQYWTLLLIAFGASFGVKGVIKGAKTFIDGKK
jgi:hypothetical protein|tara:strand:- start:18857 stop:19252 length:396 start_codon:yes stop_codon:yes gene_type:complete